MLNIENYINHFVEIWEKSPSNFPVFPRQYSTAEKLERENNFEQFQAKIKKLQSAKKAQQFRNDPGKSFFPVFKGFLETVFDYQPEHLDIILSEDFKNVSKDFFEKARAFGPELGAENIYQGLRNVWIMNGIQLMMNLPVKITPSVFAYSMIYPYSDNFLDDPTVSSFEKSRFSERFNRRLHGENLAPENHTEAQLFQLVGMFEVEYDRTDYPKVYESLYAIQKGQTDSLKLSKLNGLSTSEIRKICFEKGGTSVLADGYLVAGKLSKQQEQALFGYGVYLQLLDDIQDVKEDADAETRTMVSCLERNKSGEFVNQTINFGRTAMNEMRCFNTNNMEHFLSLMNRSIETMTIESVGLNNDWYVSDYLAELEKYSPLHFDFLRRKKEQSKSQRYALFQNYFEQVKVEEMMD